MTLLDRLLGRAIEPAPEAKAVTTGSGGSGPGVVALTYDVPLSDPAKHPQKLAAAAQRAYHENVWVHAAEWAVSSRAASVSFHLETPDGNTVGDQPGEHHPALDLLLNPSAEQFGSISAIARRRLKLLTMRHLGLCGYAFWFLDQMDALAGTPKQLIYINPARMLPATDQGGNLVGWIMDGDRPQGRQAVAFRPEEILPFILDPSDDGWLGIGLVESAWSKIRLSKHSDVHATKSLGSGGRKPGIIMPTSDKGSFTSDEYNAIVRELRNVTDSPDAAKKSLIFKSPVDYTDTGTAPEQMQLNDLMKGSRDDILAAWSVPVGQLGIATPRGMNGGQAYKGDEAVLWQGPVGVRLDVYEETIQGGLLDRYEALGQPVRIVLHRPTFDDKMPQYDLVAKSETLAMTRDERRALVGLPPLGSAYGGDIIDLPSTLLIVGSGPQGAATELDAGGEVKAALGPRELLRDLRRQTSTVWEPRLRKATAPLLDELRDKVASRVQARHGHLVNNPKDSDAWWDEDFSQRMVDTLLASEQGLAGEVGRKIHRGLQREGKAGFLDGVLEFVRVRALERALGIVGTTRDLLRTVISDGLTAGMGPAELGKAVREASAFDEYRSELIARTEAAYAYNDAAVGTYRELEVEKVEVVDGTGDEVCARVNGAIWTLDEADSDPLGHPNCTRDFIPLSA